MRAHARLQQLSCLLVVGVVGALSSTLADADQGEAAHVSVACAANFKSVLDTLAKPFEDESGCALNITAGSTGKLYAQIENGAPYDVFLSADSEHTKLLEKKGAIVPGTRMTYAIGRLALYTAGNHKLEDGAAILKTGTFKHVAIAQPELAPYGMAAKQALTHMDMWDALNPKLVFGSNITDTLHYVETGNAELGFVAYSQIRDTEGGAYWLVPANFHEPIRQEAVVLKRAESNASARRLLEFLKSEPARTLIAAAGYEFDPAP